MNTFKNLLKVVLLAWTLLPFSLSYGQRYQVGDVVENFTLTDRSTGAEVSLYDLEGKIVFLEWFAWWCPFCQAAAAQIEPGIVEYYKGLGGNQNGVEFMHVAVNLQSSQESQTQGFLDAYGIETVWNDFGRDVSDLFQTGGQPIFAIINGVANSPSHAQWELLFTRSGYNSLNAPIATFRNAIDSVAAATVAPPPLNPGPPTITQQPVSLEVEEGAAVSFSVIAENTVEARFQWSKDGVAIAGATALTLNIDSASEADRGDYSVRVTTMEGEVESSVAQLLVNIPVDSFISSMMVRSLVGRDGEPMILGFVVDGESKPVLTRAVGPSLASRGVANPLPNPKSTLVESLTNNARENDDWQMELANASVFTDIGAFALESGSLDSAIRDTVSGVRTLVISDVNGAEGVVLGEFYDLDNTIGTLTNVSVRNRVGAGDEVLTAGFVIEGDTSVRLMIRGVGPKLGSQDVEGVLQDPKLELFLSDGVQQTMLAENDDWETETSSEAVRILETGAFELDSGSKDALIMTTLPAGVYSATLSGIDGGVGVGLLEIYLLD